MTNKQTYLCAGHPKHRNGGVEKAFRPQFSLPGLISHQRHFSYEIVWLCTKHSSLFLVKNYNNKGARLHQVEVVALCSWGQVIILRKWWLVTTVMKNKRERKVSSGFVLNHRCQLAKVGPGGECKYVSLFRGDFLKCLLRGKPLIFIQRRNLKNVYSHENPQYY